MTTMVPSQALPAERASRAAILAAHDAVRELIDTAPVLLSAAEVRETYKGSGRYEVHLYIQESPAELRLLAEFLELPVTSSTARDGWLHTTAEGTWRGYGIWARTATRADELGGAL